jgi:hypothetical protein
MNYRIAAFILICALATSCKRCYQCAVRSSDGSDSIAYYMREVCVSKKDYKNYELLCNSELNNSDSLYCDCGLTSTR